MFQTRRIAFVPAFVALPLVLLSGCAEQTTESTDGVRESAEPTTNFSESTAGGVPHSDAGATESNTESESLMTPYTSDADPAYVLSHSLTRMGGEAESLETYKGKVVLIVNTASKCGFTSQYDGLQKLYEEKKGDGLVVLGFPSDNFGGQEYDTNAEVVEFCRVNYGVEFPLFEKVDVKGEGATPLFKQLAAQAGGEPKWNFTKYLVGRDGKVVEMYGSGVRPESDELTSKITELLQG
ncbi:MAG: glutathione peroxidase [Planctomycetota bacterium]